jgi:hypothetical protein
MASVPAKAVIPTKPAHQQQYHPSQAGAVRVRFLNTEVDPDPACLGTRLTRPVRNTEGEHLCVA